MMGRLGRWNVDLEVTSDAGDIVRTFRVGNVPLRYLDVWASYLHLVMERARIDYHLDLDRCWWRVARVEEAA